MKAFDHYLLSKKSPKCFEFSQLRAFLLETEVSRGFKIQETSKE